MNVLEMFLGTSGGLDAVINIAVYAVIVLLFIVGVIRCIAPISRTRATIRRAIRSIKQGATGKRSWQEDKFLGKGCLYPHSVSYTHLDVYKRQAERPASGRHYAHLAL